MPTVLFGGLMSNNEAQFEWLSWIQYLSPIKYTAEALLFNEFMYDKYEVRDTLTEFLDYKLGLYKCILIMIGLFFLFRILALFFFRNLASKA